MKSEKDNLLEQLEGSNRRAIGGAARGKTAKNEEKSGKLAVMTDGGVWGGCGRHGGRWAGVGGWRVADLSSARSPVSPLFAGGCGETGAWEADRRSLARSGL